MSKAELKIGILAVYSILTIGIGVLARIGLYSLDIDTIMKGVIEIYLYIYNFMIVIPLVWLLFVNKENRE